MGATALRLLCARMPVGADGVGDIRDGAGGARSGAPRPAHAGAQRTRPRPTAGAAQPVPPPARRSQAGRLARLTILQIGDSHTEAEHFSGRLRALFQARFGNAGRGMLAPGAPVDYWRPTRCGPSRPASGRSSRATSRTTPPCRSDCPASSCAAPAPRTVMTLAAGDDSAGFDTVEIGYYRRPTAARST